MWENCHDAAAYEEAVRLSKAAEIERGGRTQYVVACAVATCYTGNGWHVGFPDTWDMSNHKLPPPVQMIAMILKDKPAHLVGCLNLPGGKMEAGEDSVTAAVRELEEETGLKPVSAAEHMGVIRGNTCDIYCVKVPVAFSKLRQGEGETEPVSWHQVSELGVHPKLMPNLRLTIPLMLAGAKGWEIYDFEGCWRGDHHKVQLCLSAENAKGWEPITVIVKGMAHYKDQES